MSVHVVTLMMDGKERVVLVRLPSLGELALQKAMQAYPSAASGQFVGPASAQQVTEMRTHSKDVVLI